MNAHTFNELLDRRLLLTKTVLKAKNDEYGSSTDRLHNFKAAGRMSDSTPEEALKGMLMKHLVSLMDIIDHVADGRPVPGQKYRDEKIGDSVNYIILLEALLAERAKDLL